MANFINLLIVIVIIVKTEKYTIYLIPENDDVRNMIVSGITLSYGDNYYTDDYDSNSDNPRLTSDDVSEFAEEVGILFPSETSRDELTSDDLSNRDDVGCSDSTTVMVR